MALHIGISERRHRPWRGGVCPTGLARKNEPAYVSGGSFCGSQAAAEAVA